MRKDVLSILLSASLICGLIPIDGIGQKASAATDSSGMVNVLVDQEDETLITGTGWSFNTESGVLTITAADVITTDYESADSVPWADYREQIISIQWEEDVAFTKIGAYTFFGLQNMEEFELPDDVTEFGEYALANNMRWSNEIHITIKKIGRCAFMNCQSVRGSISFASSVTLLPDYCLDSCFSIESIELPKYLMSMGERTMYGCKSLTELTIPSTLTKLPEYFIAGCSGIQEVTIPDTVTMIGSCAFQGCEGLTALEIPSSVKIIGTYAFARMTSLEKMVIPETVQFIYGELFSGCSSLKYVEFENEDYTTDMLKKSGTGLGG